MNLQEKINILEKLKEERDTEERKLRFGVKPRWTGNTGYSFNHIPHVGNYDGINYAMGYSGSGTVLAAYLGAKVAYKTLNDSRGKTGYSQTKLKTNLFHIFEKPYFLFFADFWYKNIIDRWQSRIKRK